MLANYQRLYIARQIPKQSEHLVYGYIDQFLRSLSQQNIPDDVKRICLLFYYGVPEHFVHDDTDFILSKKGKLITIPRRPVLSCQRNWTSNDRSFSSNTGHIVRGSNTITPALHKTHFWKFKVSPRFSYIRIGIIEDLDSWQRYYHRWCYNSDGTITANGNPPNGDPWGFSYGQDSWDTINMELNFGGSDDEGGILSFSRGIQKLKVAFEDMDREKTYKMYCIMRTTLYTDAVKFELLEYNEYFVRDVEVSPWRKICGHCQKPKAKKRCSACKKVYYCNVQCQRRHWKYRHKKECKKLRGKSDRNKVRKKGKTERKEEGICIIESTKNISPSFAKRRRSSASDNDIYI